MLVAWLFAATFLAGHVATAGALLAEIAGRLEASGLRKALLSACLALLLCLHAGGAWAVMRSIPSRPDAGDLALAFLPGLLQLGAVLYLLLGKARRDADGAGAVLRASGREAWVGSRRAWLVNAALLVAGLAAVGVLGPYLGRVLKDFGGVLPAPTQLLVDEGLQVRRGLLPLLVGLALAHGAYWLEETVVRSSSPPGRQPRLYRWLVGAALAAYLLAVPVLGGALGFLEIALRRSGVTHIH